MEQHLNRIELRGNVGKIRISSTPSGRVAHFSLATNYVYNNRDKDTVVETCWHSIVVWEGKGIQDIDKIAKGNRVYVSGRLRQSKFTGNDGTERQVYEVIAGKVTVENREPTF